MQYLLDRNSSVLLISLRNVIYLSIYLSTQRKCVPVPDHSFGVEIGLIDSQWLDSDIQICIRALYNSVS
jgi:hypothetical protein